MEEGNVSDHYKKPVIRILNICVLVSQKAMYLTRNYMHYILIN